MKTPLARALAFITLTGFTLPASVQAHAFIDRAEPAVGSTVKEPPKTTRLLFTMAVEASTSSLKVFDASGKEVDKQDVRSDPKNPSVLSVSLPAALPAGTYRVEWRAVAAGEGHVTQGSFTFRVEP